MACYSFKMINNYVVEHLSPILWFFPFIMNEKIDILYEFAIAYLNKRTIFVESQLKYSYKI